MGGYEKTGLKTVFFAYCKNPALNTGNSITGISGIGWPLDGFLMAKYNIAKEEVDIRGGKGFKKVKVEGVKTLREALWHLEYEGVNCYKLKIVSKKKIKVELRKKKEGQEALKEIKIEGGMYEISTGRWRGIESQKDEAKTEEKKVEEEKKDVNEIKKKE